ncbi:glutamate--tRNA ligase [Celeribacter halophilus]|uniref:glutamate--tRNA ligase n=1 Tax=Celeribacter halophilus TaxID=576117 RepID=UPI001C0A07B1|nr:glutamate--tRNA ligase [Celeribacter halophilus]MBU2888516.1 glutamate--tRNA ligase [Celeribacter halophilus]MDO6509130.1 glutamate--tRNA ligase [Celeribacter halophilus]
MSPAQSETASHTPVVTRIAPSPTGDMHIGTARTALFSWLYARGRGGKFLLRIEDTDRARSTPEATQGILDGMAWLGLDYDGEAVSQFERAERHAEVAREMLAMGKAYKCFATQEEIAAFREEARAKKESTLFRSPWRDVPESDHPDAPYVIRVKAPREGVTVVKDKVQGDVTFKNDQLDDMILLRSDGTPTYMLAVVVDDHDMGVTHVIRGDDHLANAARQMTIYEAMGWPLPVYAHIPLIFGPDGKKMSKRHGAVGVKEYQAMGYPASGMRNYLARLGWSHGDDEFFTDEQAMEWFDLDGINKAPARFDTKKLENICGQHIAILPDAEILSEIDGYLAASGAQALSAEQKQRLSEALPCLKGSAKIYPQLIEKARFAFVSRPVDMDEKAQKQVNSVSNGILEELTPHLQNASWNRNALEEAIGRVMETMELGFGKIAGPLRSALAGRAVTPSVLDMMLVLGREETLARINDFREFVSENMTSE